MFQTAVSDLLIGAGYRPTLGFSELLLNSAQNLSPDYEHRQCCVRKEKQCGRHRLLVTYYAGLTR